MSREQGGSGGLIPSDVQPVLLAAAQAAGIDLRPGHFFGAILGAEPAASKVIPAPQTETDAA